jgi:hypothetical protein
MFDADRVTELGALIDQALDRADTKEDEGCRN